jgi:hypothetical protein
MEPAGSLPYSQDSSVGSYLKPDHSSPPQSNPSILKYTSILSTHLCFCLPSGLFSSSFPTNNLHAFLFFHLCYMLCPSHPSWLDLITLTILDEGYKLLIMQFPYMTRGEQEEEERTKVGVVLRDTTLWGEIPDCTRYPYQKDKRALPENLPNWSYIFLLPPLSFIFFSHNRWKRCSLCGPCRDYIMRTSYHYEWWRRCRIPPPWPCES